MSKKEQKAKEDAEFAALMADVGVKEESKVADKSKDTKPQVGEGNSKNKKKKEKKKAKQAEAPKEEPKQEAKELTAEEKQAAVKAALAKRG